MRRPLHRFALARRHTPEGKPTGRLDVVKAADVARLTQEDFDRERNKMIATCGGCHSENFARAELAKGDEMIREADHLLAEAIREIVDLYEDGFLAKPDHYAACHRATELDLAGITAG